MIARSNNDRRPRIGYPSECHFCEDKHDVADNKVPCFVMERRPSGDEAQPAHHETVIAFWGITKAETRMEHSTSALNYI